MLTFYTRVLTIRTIKHLKIAVVFLRNTWWNVYRRMFPALRYSISGLNPHQDYIMVIELCAADTYRYKYHESEWWISGKTYPDVKKQNRINIHLDSPSNGAKWNSNVVSFHKSKITNNTSGNKKQVSAWIWVVIIILTSRIFLKYIRTIAEYDKNKNYDVNIHDSCRSIRRKKTI